MDAPKPKKTMTPEAIAANRANAQKSTGPKTPEGKEKSKYNALKFGLYCADPIIPGESLDDYREFHLSMFHTLTPQNPVQWFYFDQITSQMWSLQRLIKTEGNIEVFTVFQEDHTHQLDKLSIIQQRKVNTLSKLMRDLRTTRDRAFISQHVESLLALVSDTLHSPDSSAPSHPEMPPTLPVDPEGVVMEISDIVECATVARERMLKNPRDFQTSAFAKQVDMMLGLLDMPNPTVIDIIRNRLRNHPRHLEMLDQQASA